MPFGTGASPLATLRFQGAPKRTTFKSAQRPKTANPVWQEDFKFAADDGVLEVSIEDYHLMGKNDPMGHFEVPLASLDRNVHRGWHALPQGEIELGLRWVFDPECSLALPEAFRRETEQLPPNVLHCFIGRGCFTSPQFFLALNVGLAGSARARGETKTRSGATPEWAECFEWPVEDSAELFELTGDFELVSDLIAFVSMRSIRNWHQV